MTDKLKKATRTTAGLRDVLFDEIDKMRGADADPQRAMAITNLSKQIIGTAKAEMEFHRTMAALDGAGANVSLGTLVLGSK